jgi:hypothetical protein
MRQVALLLVALSVIETLALMIILHDVLPKLLRAASCG